MGGGAAGDLRCHQIWSPSSPPSWMLSRIKDQVRRVRIDTFLRLTCEITHNNYFASFYPQALLLFLKDVGKTCIFTQKWLDHMLLLASYLETMVTDHHLTCLKMRARNKRTATENFMC